MTIKNYRQIKLKNDLTVLLIMSVELYKKSDTTENASLCKLGKISKFLFDVRSTSMVECFDSSEWRTVSKSSKFTVVKFSTDADDETVDSTVRTSELLLSANSCKNMHQDI